MKALLSLLLMLSFSASASILPPNDLHLEDNLFTEDANMTEQEFSQIIDSIIDPYRDVVASHGGNLEVKKLWTNSTVNASAQQIGSSWIVNMYGGLARRPEVTQDGFALVVCHELGHHLGGYAFYGNGQWAASEGQSDYFASQACARRVWAADTAKNAEFRNNVHPTAKSGCDTAWQTEADQNLCYRIAMAGESLAGLLAALGNATVDFDRPDTSKVSTTNTRHPKGQCRLDTYFAGALCKAEFDPMVIPGRNHPQGQTSVDAEREAAKYSCTRAAFHAMGNRPRCWFKPQLESLLSIKSIQIEEISGNNNGAMEPGETVGLWIQLENLATKAYQNVSAKISSIGDKFDVIKGETVFSEITSGLSKAQDNAFEIKLSRVTCGEKFDVDLGLDLGGSQVAHIRKTLQTGKVSTTETLTNTESMDIPDNSIQGVTSSIVVNDEGVFSEATVTVDITHPYVGDLTVKLLTPTGGEVILQQRKGGSADDLKKSFTVELPSGTTANGDWKLFLSDSAKRDAGNLNNWAIQFKKISCE